MLSIRNRKTMPTRNVPPTHAQLSGAPCVSTYERQSRSGTPVNSAMYGSESDTCLSGGGSSSLQAIVLEGECSADIDGNVHWAKMSEQRRSVVVRRLPSLVLGLGSWVFVLPSSVFRLLRDLRPDPLEALAHVRRPIGPVVLSGPLVIHDRHAKALDAPLERAVLVHEPVLGAAIHEEHRHRRSSISRHEVFQAAGGIARPPGRGVLPERGSDERPEASPCLFECYAVCSPLRMPVERMRPLVQRRQHAGV